MLTRALRWVGASYPAQSDFLKTTVKQETGQNKEFSEEADLLIDKVSKKLKKYKLNADVEKTISECCSETIISVMTKADEDIDALVKVMEDEAAQKKAQRDLKAKEKADREAGGEQPPPLFGSS